jgi:leucyl-tRNA synthetase
MMGYNVLRVMGWDAFGLPTERQAVREGRHPREITSRNIATFKRQLHKLGLSYDWTREIATSHPGYYRWTQWIFLQLHEKGLAYQQAAPVNWCPALATVLANEEVKDGVYIETGDPVERRMMTQWMLRITAYAERLLEGLEHLDWPESIKAKQREWIGRSVGADIRFAVKSRSETVEVFTTRPDTIFGCTYLVLAPEHELVSRVTTPDQAQVVTEYCREAGGRSERERQAQAADDIKTGVFTGAYAVNPVNGEEIPIWIADYVLATHGTGAVFACPAHDERDHAFARQFGLPIREVVAGGNTEEQAFTGDGPHLHSDFLNGLRNAEAIDSMVEWLVHHERGRRAVRYRLRDWLFSRQRYWGEPFPLMELEDGTIETIPETQLPVELPDLEDYSATEDGRPALARADDWVRIMDKNGKPALRPIHTMPQWAGSCWYYLRFISPRLETHPWDPDEERYWMPVDLYVGGAEHAVLHLLYARFWHLVLYDLGLVSTPEPFQRLVNQGMIHHTSYRDGRGKYYYREEVEERDNEWRVKETHEAVEARREKMSKSRFNVVSPDDMCGRYGADALRLYELFMGPIEDANDWDTSGVPGMRRFLERIWRLVWDDREDRLRDHLVDGPVDNVAVDRQLHSAIKKVADSVESLRFNTAISEMMIFVNQAVRAELVSKEWMETFLKILCPFAPHIAEELWQKLGHEVGLIDAVWPEYDEAKLAVETVTIAVQVDGKLRGTVVVRSEANQEEAVKEARLSPKVAESLEGRTLRKEIYVPGRLLNFVTK